MPSTGLPKSEEDVLVEVVEQALASNGWNKGGRVRVSRFARHTSRSHVGKEGILWNSPNRDHRDPNPSYRLVKFPDGEQLWIMDQDLELVK